MKIRHYTPEIKDRVVFMLIEAKDGYPSTWAAIQARASKIGCTSDTLRSWHKKYIDQTPILIASPKKSKFHTPVLYTI